MKCYQRKYVFYGFCEKRSIDNFLGSYNKNAWDENYASGVAFAPAIHYQSDKKNNENYQKLPIRILLMIDNYSFLICSS